MAKRISIALQRWRRLVRPAWSHTKECTATIPTISRVAVAVEPVETVAAAAVVALAVWWMA